jgi:hypothetical protein
MVKRERASVIEAVLSAMRSGASMNMACKLAQVSRSAFFEWIDEDPILADNYASARAHLLDIQAEQLEEISDQAVAAETAIEVAGLRLKSDNRKWLLSKLAPRKYGEKIAIGGADDLPAIKSQTELSDDALLAIATKALTPSS